MHLSIPKDHGSEHILWQIVGGRCALEFNRRERLSFEIQCDARRQRVVRGVRDHSEIDDAATVALFIEPPIAGMPLNVSHLTEILLFYDHAHANSQILLLNGVVAVIKEEDLPEGQIKKGRKHKNTKSSDQSSEKERQGDGKSKRTRTMLTNRVCARVLHGRCHRLQFLRTSRCAELFGAVRVQIRV